MPIYLYNYITIKLITMVYGDPEFDNFIFHMPNTAVI